jgi:hypothetical protein
LFFNETRGVLLMRTVELDTELPGATPEFSSNQHLVGVENPESGRANRAIHPPATQNVRET